MRSCSLAFLITLLSFSHSFSTDLQTLEYLLHQAEGEERIDLCQRLIDASLPDHPMQALEYLDVGLEQAQKLMLPLAEADFIISLGKIHAAYFQSRAELNDVNLKLQGSQEYLAGIEEQIHGGIEKEIKEEEVQLRLGYIHYYLAQNSLTVRNYELATINAIRAIMYFDFLGKSEQILEARVLMAEIYLKRGLFDQVNTDPEYQEYQTLSEDAGPYISALQHYQEGLIYHYNKKYNDAIKSFFVAITFAEKSGKNLLLMKIYQELGKAHYETGHFRAAQDAYRHVSLMADKPWLKPFKINCMIGEAEALAALGKSKLALNIMTDAEEMTVEAQMDFFLPDVYKSYANVYQWSGDYANAIQFLNKRDAALNRLTTPMLDNPVDYEREGTIDSRNVQVEDLKKDVENQSEILNRRKNYLIMLGWGALLLLVLFIQKNRINRELEAKVAYRTEALTVANDNLVHLNKELDRFAYRTTHDIRGPVARILGLCQVGLTTDPNNANMYLEMAHKESMRMDQMLHRFLDVNHIKIIKESPVELDLKEISSKAISILPNAQKVNVLINLEAAQYVYADRELVEIIFRNIIENAFYFANPEEKYRYLEISSIRTEEDVKIRFADNGIGIDPNIVHHVFDMFYRGTNQSKGLGLGLYAARLAAERLGGSVQYVDMEKDTCFELSIPFSRKKV